MAKLEEIFKISAEICENLAPSQKNCYDYRLALYTDLCSLAAENAARLCSCDLAEALKDLAWDEDSVTGNGSGSYTVSAYEAEKNLMGNWTMLADVCESFDIPCDFSKGAEYYDVTIRCCLLDEVASIVARDIRAVMDECRRCLENNCKQSCNTEYVELDALRNGSVIIISHYGEIVEKIPA